MVEAERLTLEFVRRFVPEKASPLCGSSIHQDRRFLVRYMPQLNGFLHYRIVDVSSIKEVVARWYPFDPKPVPKTKDHQALGDVRDSIAELIFYRKKFFR